MLFPRRERWLIYLEQRAAEPVLNQLWNIGANTVEVCSEDAYVDCIDRERGQWDADARTNTAVARGLASQASIRPMSRAMAVPITREWE